MYRIYPWQPVFTYPAIITTFTNTFTNTTDNDISSIDYDH